MTLSPELLHVIRCYDRLPPLPGGMERHIAELTAAQRELGVRVTELYNGGEPAGESVQVWRGRRIDKLRPGFVRQALFYAAAVRKRFDFSDGRLRVVHAHGDWPSFLFGSIFGRLIGADTVAASLHATTHAPLSRYALALRRCNPVFTTGARQAAQFSEMLRRPVVHLPSAPSDLFFQGSSAASKVIDIIAVGSLVPVKNLHLLLECAARRHALSFAIVGTGPEESTLRHKAEILGLHNVQFRGALSLEEVRSVMQSARLFINTSVTEGSPTAALEAMACGLPVVMTPGNDYSDFVDQGVNGWITGDWDVGEIVNAIDLFLANPARLRTAGQEARRTAQRHRWREKARIVTSEMMMALARNQGNQAIARS